MRIVTAILACAALAGGCSGMNSEYVTPQRLDQGLVIVLPGIEGEGPLSAGIREGLLDANVTSAIAIYRWGRPIPLAGPLINQVDVLGNRLAGDRIAELVVNYQDSHPGKPVYIIGHSGGGGVAVFTAEALPEGRKVDGLILLSASISSGYDLGKAQLHCRKGIANFYSKADVGLLVIGTTVVGNVDGGHGPSAGAAGFSRSAPQLYQIGWSEGMAASGNTGGHMGTAAASFISSYIAPWVVAQSWPAGGYDLARRAR